MKHKVLVPVLAAVVGLAALTGFVVAAHAGPKPPLPPPAVGPPPPGPPFANPDGTVDWSRIPTHVNVAPGGSTRGPDGREIPGPAVDALGQTGPPVVVENPIAGPPPTPPIPPDVKGGN